MNVREIIGQKVRLVIKKRHFLSCCLGRLVTDQTQQPHTVGKQQGHKNHQRADPVWLLWRKRETKKGCEKAAKRQT